MAVAPDSQLDNQPDEESVLNQARRDYRERVREWRENLSTGDLDGANRALERGDELAQQWRDQGQLEKLLEPLLAEEEEPDVRGAAARQLLSQQVNEKALEALRQLRDSDDPRIARFAARALSPSSRLHIGNNAEQ